LSPSQPQSVPFGIYQDDFYDPDVLLSKDQNGTDKRSGLRWPKVFGSNRGRPFWYSATLPDVVRDLVQHCFPEPDAYYRLPWTNAESHGVGQGNNTPLNLTDPDPSHRLGSSQAFAFDFTMPAGTLLRAARGGRVEWVRETHPDAIYDETQPENPTTNHPWGNALRIRHQDGSTSWYFHLRMNRVRVQKGDVVQRGQPIARSGNSGRSTGPHLHFQVQANSKDWGQTIRIRFGGTSFSPTKSGCLSPGKGAVLVSDNANPKFP